MTRPIRYLEIPLSHDGIVRAQIPFGMRKEDFELLIKSLELWKERLVYDPPQYTIDQAAIDNEMTRYAGTGFAYIMKDDTRHDNL